MSETSDYTIVISGPLAQRSAVLATLDRQTVLCPDGAHQRGDPHGFDDSDPTVGWVTCRHTDIDTVAAIAVRHGWQLRAHHPTPEPAEAVEVVPAGTLDRLDRLEQALAAKGVI